MAIQFIGGKILFDTSKIAFNSDCCCGAEGCSWCISTPAQLQVEIVVVTENTCGDCDSINDIFILDQVGGTDGNCTWSHTLASPICGITEINAMFVGSGALNVRLRASGVDYCTFGVSGLGDPAACTEWTGTDLGELALTNITDDWFGVECECPSAIAFVRSL